MAGQSSPLNTLKLERVFSIETPQPIRQQYRLYTPQQMIAPSTDNKIQGDKEAMDEIFGIMKKTKKKNMKSDQINFHFAPQRTSNPFILNLKQADQEKDMDPFYCKLSRQNTLNSSMSTTDQSDSSIIQESLSPLKPPASYEIQQKFSYVQQNTEQPLKCRKKLEFQEQLQFKSKLIIQSI